MTPEALALHYVIMGRTENGSDALFGLADDAGAAEAFTLAWRAKLARMRSWTRSWRPARMLVLPGGNLPLFVPTAA